MGFFGGARRDPLRRVRCRLRKRFPASRISFDEEYKIPTTMHAMFAKWERSQMRKRVKRALGEKARSGYATGGDV